ncbi:heparinase II/III family protein [Paracoccaceae bacterium GXU_MW_L88]
MTDDPVYPLRWFLARFGAGAALDDLPALAGDPEEGARLAGGDIVLPSGDVDAAPGTTIFDVAPRGAADVEAIHSHAWLPALAAHDPAKAAAWLGHWMRGVSKEALGAAVTAQRLAIWLAPPPELRAALSSNEAKAFDRLRTRQLRYLAKIDAPTPLSAFQAQCTLWAAAIQRGHTTRPGTFDAALGALFPQGELTTRQPADLVRMLDALRLPRAALTAQNQPADEVLEITVHRLVPMIRALRMGDGRMARFHGMGLPAARVDRALVAARFRGDALPQRVSGFHRISGGRTKIVADAGPTPPEGHHSGLAFELSVGRRPLVVNCGEGHGPGWQAALRRPAAHSGPELPDRAFEGAETHHHDTHGGSWLTMVQDPIRRALFVTHDGALVWGEDHVLREVQRLRFHLHPDVTATQDDTAINLTLGSGEIWHFGLHGGTARLETSVYLSAGHSRETRQIVVIPNDIGYGSGIEWSFSREGGGPDKTVRDPVPRL